MIREDREHQSRGRRGRGRRYYQEHNRKVLARPQAVVEAQSLLFVFTACVSMRKP